MAFPKHTFKMGIEARCHEARCANPPFAIKRWREWQELVPTMKLRIFDKEFRN